ncbi:MAG: hypothetical protein NC331_01885 [Lachnospiraceae bacterium]|nr:hypothetical protein [Lachnospiraceae bacterium]MCM1238117.1 hypothetical protein [Lachnospiraceae bacterium]
MTLRDKVGMLVRYCGQYQSHGFMMDERNTDEQFNVELPEEKYIRENIDELKVILLTGEAGDGKSRIIRNLKNRLVESGFSEPCGDFSALQDKEKEELINRLSAVLEGTSSERLIISANVGIFTQAVIQFSGNLMEELTKERKDIYVCNFENRNLAENENFFGDIMSAFLSYEKECDEATCPCFGYCSYKKNLDKLLSSAGVKAMRTICDAIYLIGGHITFRELLSLLAYTVTFGQDCIQRRREVEAEIKSIGNSDGPEAFERLSRLEELKEKKLYYHVFEESDDLLLRKVSRMDPGLERQRYKGINSREAYRNEQRKAFFETGQDAYGMLHVEYLKEFREALEHIHKPPFYFDTAIDDNPVLRQLKKGINKIGNQEKSETGLTVTDVPAIFDKKIRMEFLVTQDISMIWHRYDLQLGGKKPEEGSKWNKFYLSYQHKDEKGRRKLISLLIDYNQFRYLMLCSYDYFLNRNGLSQEEYAVNTFYRKILSIKKDAYDTVKVCFDDSLMKYCDFTLKIHAETDFWTDDEHRTILIGRGD